MTTTANPINPILQIEQQYGQSIWMDNLSRDLITSGELKSLIADRGIYGITSNPAIFEKAIAGNKIYDEAIKAGIDAGKSVMEIYESLVFTDIQNACDIFAQVYQETQCIDGYVSIEVPPTISKDTNTTITEAKRYYAMIDRPNVMIKIPGTTEGLPAVTNVIGAGISVNVTLLFAVESYIATAWAYIEGLEQALAAGKDLTTIASVASFFLSRIDSNIDDRLSKIKATNLGKEVKAKADSLMGKVAIANAKIAYQKYKEIFNESNPRWAKLAAEGARVQRLLWASTSTKNPDYSDVMYVDELIGDNTVNTLPPNTIEACADHCSPAARIETDLPTAEQVLKGLQDPAIAIDLDQVMAELLEDGIDKFVKPFESLLESLANKVSQLS
jgi:transaldolase